MALIVIANEFDIRSTKKNNLPTKQADEQTLLISAAQLT